MKKKIDKYNRWKEEIKRLEVCMTIMIIVFILVMLISYFILELFDKEEPLLNATWECIANKSLLVISKTCSHCARQEEILEEGMNFIQVIDCIETPEICNKMNITRVPMWFINNIEYKKILSKKELLNLTKC